MATRLGSLAFFMGAWVAMMAAMMLPGAAPAVARAARAGGMRAVPEFAGSYLAVWALAGAVVFAACRPHGTAAVGAVTIAAGAYEFTPLKRHFRRRCRESLRVGSRVRAVLRRLQRRADGDAGGAGRDERRVDGRDRCPGHRAEAPAPRAARDVPLAVAVVAVGVLIIVDPSPVPGLTPPM